MNIITFFINDPAFILTCTRWCRSFVPFIVLSIIFAFLVIIPQQWRHNSQLTINKKIKIGASIVTTTGLQGKVWSTSENFIILELDDGRKVEIVRQAVASVHHD